MQWCGPVPKAKEELVLHVAPPIAKWLHAAAIIADVSEDFFIKIEIEVTGVTVIAKSGDDYETQTVLWEALALLKINPFPEIIAEVEKRLAARAVMERAERMVGHG